jgi:phosphoribosylformylglycinamidine synthase I
MPIDVTLIRAAGTNCDRELAHAFTLAGATVATIHLSALIANPTLLDKPGILAFPGGFSFGDDIASGKIVANQLRHHLAAPLREFIAAGKLILGVCNGFQILIKSGLLPGPIPQLPPDDLHPATLTHNNHGQFQDRWVTVRSCSSLCKWFPTNQEIELPIAHAEGRFATRNPTILNHLQANDQIAFRYVGENPNGSADNIAGICDITGRVLGLMPHPERAINPHTLPTWTRAATTPTAPALKLFTTALDYIQAHHAVAFS